MLVLMYAPDDLRVMGTCEGPEACGRCPRVAAGQEVPCWGLDLVEAKDGESTSRGLVRRRIRVLPGAQRCPMAPAGLAQETARGYFSPFTPCR